MHTNILEEVLVQIISYLVPVVEACGALVIMLGVTRTIVHHIRDRFHLDMLCLRGLRTELVESLIMGLEFQLAADVLKTAVSPSWDRILLLAALIALRVVLSLLLERELHAVCGPERWNEQEVAEHCTESQGQV